MWLILLSLFACEEEKTLIENLELRDEFGEIVESLNFEDVYVGQYSQKNVGLINAGNDIVDILSVTMVDVSANVWDLNWTEQTELQPGEMAEFAIKFEPMESEEYSARIQIRNNTSILPIIYINVTGEGGLSVLDVDEDGLSPVEGDCDDSNAETYPGAEEICDGEDNNCDNIIPDEEDDRDVDGYMICEDDCDDQDNSVYPGAEEICDDKDSDCDGTIDDHLDRDGDGLTHCDGDCDDFNALRYPGATEICDYIDNNCSGYIDDIDNDNDGHSACPYGGDCNDSDPNAHPVRFNSQAPPEGDGSVDHPYDTMNAAIEGMDEICRTVMVEKGTHQAAVGWSGDLLRVVGAAEDPSMVTIKPWDQNADRIFRVFSGSSLEIKNVTLFGVDHYPYLGGAVYSDGGDVILDGVSVIDNQSNAGGIIAVVDNGSLSVQNSSFSYNVTNGYGGAIMVEDSVFSDFNSSYVANESLQGGAIHLRNSIATLINPLIHGNTVGDEGGGIAVYDNSDIEIVGGRFWDNQAIGYGGAIVMRNLGASPFLVRRNQFFGNISANAGGGLAILGSQASGMIANNTFVSNTAVNHGAGVFAEPDSSISSVWYWGNIDAYSSGSSAVSLSENASPSVAFSTCHEPSTDCFNMPSSANQFLNVDGTIDTIGASNPLFVDYTDNNIPSDDDFALWPPNPYDQNLCPIPWTPSSSCSPAINSGPIQGLGPGYFMDWTDEDGSENNRGHTGGPAIEP